MHQAAMRSPHTSPSLRTIAHMHNRASYFPSPPSSPGPIPSSPSQHNVHQHQSYPTTSSPLASPRIGSPRTTDPVRPSPASRRPTFTSAIPIGYGHAHVHSQSYSHPHHSPSLPSAGQYAAPPSPRTDPRSHTQSLGDTRRRPSFKIDLPPRPAPAEILAVESPGEMGHTPFTAHGGGKSTPSNLTRDEVGAGRKLSLGPLEMTDLRTEIDSIAYSASIPEDFPIATYNGKPPSAAPTFRDPFASVAPRSTAPAPKEEESYVIIRAPTRRMDEDSREGSPKWRENDPFAGAVGLGYSLNRLRAPTPWVRKSGEDGEWLSAEDVAGL